MVLCSAARRDARPRRPAETRCSTSSRPSFWTARRSADVGVARELADQRRSTSHAKIREVSPGDRRESRHNPDQGRAPGWPSQWPLGTPVVGTLRSLAARRDRCCPTPPSPPPKANPPCGWSTPKTAPVSLREISVARYRQSDFVVTGGVAPHRPRSSPKAESSSGKARQSPGKASEMTLNRISTTLPLILSRSRCLSAATKARLHGRAGEVPRPVKAVIG